MCLIEANHAQMSQPARQNFIRRCAGIQTVHPQSAKLQLCRGPTMSDKKILEHITALVDEEHRLRDDHAARDQHAERLRHLAEQLDQCWDLLRQRRAKREFGDDPAEAAIRDVLTVETYKG